MVSTALVACGGGNENEGTIPSQTGEGIVAKLEDVQAKFDAGKCEAAEASAAEIQDAIESVREAGEVEGELEETLVEASGNLVELVRTDCEEAEPNPDPEPDPIDPDPTGTTGAQGLEEG